MLLADTVADQLLEMGP
jgi:hypothetical protein